MKQNCLKTCLAFSTAIGTTLVVASPALAQSSDTGGLSEIIVTAQRREQRLQDVPVAVTAIGADALQANRITNVVDLSGLAPGVNVRVSAGGSALPIFAIRGALSYGVVPGSDKQASIYLDGVYISSPRGSIFDLPDVARIEVLRGPQGTLFGRNSTTGAISIATRDPSGEAGVSAMVSAGNRDYRQFQMTANTPQIGPFSAYFSFVHLEKRGDIENLGAGAVWNRNNSADPRIAKITRSPRWLGSKDSNTYFAAVKFESGDFSTVYKYDRTESAGTPEATSLIGYTRTSPLTGNLINSLITSQPVPIPIASNINKRPKAVFNSYATPFDQTNQGHSLTSTYFASDHITIKNILAHRNSFIWATSSIDGVSSLRFTTQAIAPFATFAGISRLAAQGVNVQNPANAALVQSTIAAIAAQVTPLVGQPFIGIASGAQSRSKQWSDEFQINYTSDFMNATVGALWTNTTDRTAEQRLQNTISFDFVPGGILPNKNIGEGLNKAESLAGYAQAELHLTPQIDIVLGGRLTHDKKSGTFTYGASLATLGIIPFKYSDTRFTYLAGVNYKPTQDILVYGKYSTGYVTGGSTAGIPYDPETARSAELGFKGEFLDRKLRTNLAVWWAEYKNVQGPQSATTFVSEITQITGIPGLASYIGTFVLDLGTRKAKGAEFEFDAAPVPGLTLGGALSYTDTKLTDVPPLVLSATGGIYTGKQNVPKWQGSVYAQYKTEPLFGDAHMTFRMDGIWTGDSDADSNPRRRLFAELSPTDPEQYSIIDAYWVVNGRVALKDVDLGGVKTEIAVWARNLFDAQRLSYGLNLSELFYAGNYIPARSFGMDLRVSF